MTPSLVKKKIALIAHRGTRDARPENTLEAFAYALSIGVTALETDVQITADGVPVLSHSRIVPWYLAKNEWGHYLSTDEQPTITHTCLSHLKQLDFSKMSEHAPFGEWERHGKTQRTGLTGQPTRLATLEELFQLVHLWGNEEVELCIEAKSIPYPNVPNPSPEEWVHAIYDLACAYGMVDRIYLQSFDWRVLVAAKRIDPKIRTVALTANQPEWNLEGDEGDYQNERWMGCEGDPIELASSIGAYIYAPYEKTVTRELINRVHSLGMHLIPYTVNDEKRMRELIEMGVDGILTDRPKQARAVMEGMGISLPQPDPNPQGKPFFTGTEGV